MDAPIHSACGTRHWSTQPCPADKDDTKPFVRAAAKQTLERSEWDPPKKSAVRKEGAKEEPILVADVRPTDAKLETRKATVADVGGCPVCAARREKKAAAMRRYREKAK